MRGIKVLHQFFITSLAASSCSSGPGGPGASQPQPDLPKIVSLSPATGPSSGGINVTISGSGFGGNAKLAFADIEAEELSFISNTKLIAKLPSRLGFQGKVPVKFTNKDGNYTIEPNLFSYYTSIPNFIAPRLFMISSSSANKNIALGDINEDGKLDLVAVDEISPQGSVSILLGNGDGTFQAVRSNIVFAGNVPSSIRVLDVNGDKKPDLITSNRVGGNVSVILGNGDGSFQSQIIVPSSQSPYDVAVDDINADGKQDLIVPDHINFSVSIHLGNNDGTFQSPRTYSTENGPYAVASSELNNDGKKDIIVTNQGNASISTLLGNGDGSFQARRTFSVGKSPMALAAGDFNNDGKIDIVTANAGDKFISVLLGNGDGAFQMAKSFFTKEPANRIIANDLNGDGLQDIILSQSDNNLGACIFLGNGDGTFKEHKDFPASNSAGSLISIGMADLNADGKPDLALSNAGFNLVVLLNSFM